MNISPYLAWFLIGVVFLIAELFAPGFILIFFTAGCWATAAIVHFTDISLTCQIMIFIFSSLVLLFTLRKYSMNIFIGNTSDSVNDNYADSKIGKTALVTKEITPTSQGEIKVMGSFWRAIADTDISKGQSVVIIRRETEDSLTLKVKTI